MLNTIYVLKNTVNQKVYVGQTWRTLKERWDAGSGYAKCRHLNHAIKKYGKSAFYYEILTFCGTQETADYWEKHFIDRYDSIKNGYNLADGGLTSGRVSEETKRILREKNLGQKRSAETRKKMSVAKLGTVGNATGSKKTAEAKAKIGEANRNRSAETRAKLSIACSERKPHLGHKHSEENKRKASERYKGKSWRIIDGKRVWTEGETK